MRKLMRSHSLSDQMQFQSQISCRLYHNSCLPSALVHSGDTIPPLLTQAILRETGTYNTLLHHRPSLPFNLRTKLAIGQILPGHMSSITTSLHRLSDIERRFKVLLSVQWCIDSVNHQTNSINHTTKTILAICLFPALKLLKIRSLESSSRILQEFLKNFQGGEIILWGTFQYCTLKV